MTSKTSPIGVFDSGVGGLSILREIQLLLPNEDYIFVADQAYVPYGEKTARQLQDRSLRIARFLLKRKIKLLVVACNTATCYAVEVLRKNIPVTVVGTVPAVKPAVVQSRSGIIAVISTPATSRSKMLKDLITIHAQDRAVLTIGCPGLENAVEAGNISGPLVKKLLKQYVSPLKNFGVDQIVLGCTHYPFLTEQIKLITGPEIQFTDSGLAIAQRVSALLNKDRLINPRKQPGGTFYFTTGDPKRFTRIASRLLKRSISSQRASL